MLAVPSNANSLMALATQQRTINPENPRAKLRLYFLSNRSRKRFSLYAPLRESGPFRGFFCAYTMGMPVHPSARDSADTQAVAARQREVATRLLRWIMGGIVVWGAVHALGAWTLNHDVRRPLIVLICVAAFLGFWLAMLASRRQRMKKKHGPLG